MQYACHITQSGWITTKYKQQLRNNVILWRGLFRNAQKCDAPFYGAGVSGLTVM
jgi:hypothetical protein